MLQIVLLPIVCGLICQLLKLIFSAFTGKFSWGELNSYGGMPSSHSAFVSSLAVVAGYYEGWTSVAFSIALVFAILTIRDAIGFRRILGKHAQIINQMVHQMPDSNKSDYQQLSTRLGHKPGEALAGALIGVAVTLIYVLLTR
ncbi:MAG TPA: divergent PAP2 family protein [Candidatus Bipolaricaulota bacterium]|nr:divergent PAP2 family protein [Candidatus Bipolaricaulota bacterium]